jgi:hypothetical protein
MSRHNKDIILHPTLDATRAAPHAVEPIRFIATSSSSTLPSDFRSAFRLPPAEQPSPQQHMPQATPSTQGPSDKIRGRAATSHWLKSLTSRRRQSDNRCLMRLGVWDARRVLPDDIAAANNVRPGSVVLRKLRRRNLKYSFPAVV